MKKRILTALLVVCLVFALGTVTALADEETDTTVVAKIGNEEYSTLAEAISMVSDNETIVLQKDYVIPSAINIDENKSFTLDLGGYKLSYSGDSRFFNVMNADLVLENGTFEYTGTANLCAIMVYNSSSFKLASDATIKSGGWALGVDQSAKDVKIVLDGTITGGHGFTVNGAVKGSDTNVEVEVNGSIEVGGYGLYLAGPAETSINPGASIDADVTGIEIRAGELNISGGDIKGGTTYVVTSNGGGTTSEGAGIAVAQHTTKLPITVNITGGSVSGAVAFSQDDPQGNNDGEHITLSISGGSFKSTAENESGEKYEAIVTNTENVLAVTGGKFLKSDNTASDVSDYIPKDVSMKFDETTGEVVVDDTKTVATVDGVGYPSLEKAIDAADAGDTVELLKEVTLTTELSITKNITIDGNGKKLTLTAAADSQGLSIGAKGVTLDNVNLTITGTQNISADGIDVWGTLNLKNSTVSISDLRSAFVMQGGVNAKLNINNSTVNVKDITGNGTNGGYVVIEEDSNVTFDRVGSHGLSVEKVTVTDSSLSFTDVAYCALYGQEIVLGSGADVEIEGCGTGLPRDGWGNVKYQAPVQVKVVAGDTDNGITVNSGASLTVTGTNDAIYIPEGTGFVSNGYVSADIVLGDTDMSVVTFVNNSTRQIKLVEDDTKIKLPDPGKYLGREFVGWECSLNDRVYPEGYEYKVTRDVTFTAVWEAAAYDIVIDDDILHGDIWTSPKSEAEAGDTVYIYVDPDTGYVLDDIDVYYGYNYRNSVKVSYVRNNTYRFEMPNADVYITATFKANGMPFVDVHRTQWFYDSIYYVWSNDMMEGDSATTFNPDGTMTRAMFWAVLGRMDGQTITGTNWVEQARNWAMREGVSDGTNPNDYVTREQMVTMLWRYAGEKNGSANLNRYTDSGSVSGYAVEAMRWAIGNGVIQGVTSTTLAPKANATRAECATIFMRFDKM